MSVFDKQEQEAVHEYSLLNLSENGILIRSQAVLRMLEESGADVDYGTGVARFAESMVSEALAKAPKRFKLHAREPSNDLEVPVSGCVPHIATDGLTVYTLDIETGQRRKATRDDLADFAKLADALEAIDFFWPIVTVSDVPEAAHSVHEMWTSLQGCAMHVQGMCLSRLDAITEVDLAALLVGGKEELKKRPIFSVILCSISPLSFEKGLVEAQVELARAGIPIVSMSMSISGLSSPVTFAGTIVNINTENLASLIITQFAQPGAPHVYCSESAPVDVLSGNMNYCAPELLPISVAAGQMARRYELPSMVGSWGIGGGGLSRSTSLSMIAGGLMRVFSDTDLSCGFGGLDNDLGCSLEQMIIDSFEWENLTAYMKEYTINREMAALDVVKKVGHGNTFLTHPHTARNFKDELFLIDRKKMKDWTTFVDGKISEGKDTAKKMLREHVVEKIDPELTKEGDRLMKEYEKALVS